MAIRMAIAGAVVAAAALTGATGTSHADGVLTDSERAYADRYWSAICDVIGQGVIEDSGPEAVIGVGMGIMDDGFEPDNAADIITYAVDEYCPEYLSTLLATKRKYGG